MAKDNNRSNSLINENIRSKELRLIDDEGNNKGVVKTSDALALAKEKDLDLVIVSPGQEPPVAKILDYGKYRYEVEKRAKEARKKQKSAEIKEIKIRYKIDVHDYNVRIKNIKKFLAEGNKVKITVMLRGREMQHSKLAYELAARFLEDLKDTTFTLERKPILEGRNVITIVAP
ncbi:MAG: translation initiation factor IF-3 [Candidatus Gastranaerophilaceae bacterium]